MISVDNLTVSFGGTDLFKNISFLINAKDRVGLVGKNGAGKSTMLKILIGEQAPTSGSVSKNGDCTLGYLPQQMKIADSTTLFKETAKAFDEVIALEKEIEAINHQITTRTDYESDSYSALIHRLTEATDRYHILGGDNREAEIEKTLLGLGFKREEFDKPSREFSGGWRMRIELAKLLLKKPSIFLLDEPTNHLDIESIQWLESYLKEYNGAVVLISHDRAFLDNITTRTIELSLGKAYDYKVPYSKYVELRAERRAQQMAAYTNQQRMIEQTQEFIERFRYKPTKSNQVQSRMKQLEKLDIIEVDEEDLSTLNIKFPPAPRSGQVVVEAKGVGKAFGEKRVFSGADIVIERGEKVALVGRNGEGKTTFSRLVLNEIEPTEGSIRIGHNVHIGYFAQNQDDLMDGDFTVYDTLDRVAVGDIRTRLRDILGAFLFRGEDIDKKVRVLSGGERSRLAMARLMLEPYNLLILDEPTNHMDMRSKDILKKALMDYNGTVIVVSHDREFLDGLVNKVYEFRDGMVKEHLGGIYDFLEKKKMQSLRELEMKQAAPRTEPGNQDKGNQQPQPDKKDLSGNNANANPARTGGKTTGNSEPNQGQAKNSGAQRSGPATPTQADKVRSMTYEQKREYDKQVRRLTSQIEKTEAEIAEKENEIWEMDHKMSDPSAHGIDLTDGSVYAAYDALKKSVAELMDRWEQLNNELNAIK